MKLPLLLLLALPLSCLAQYRPMYSAPRPSSTPTYTPAPRYNNTNYNQQQQHQQYTHQQFQRQQTQQTQLQMQNYMRMSNQQQSQLRWQQIAQQQQLQRQRRSAQQIADDKARQQQAEQKANEQLAQLAQEQQRKRQEQPAADPQQASAQQQADARQLTQLAVKNYQEVFLPGQVTAALETQTLSAKGQQDLQNISKELLSSAWWEQQEPAQLKEKLSARSQALATLTSELLGFDVAATPPTAAAPLASAKLDDMLAHDSFDQSAASQLLRDAAQADKLAAAPPLTEAVRNFTALAAKVAATPAGTASEQKLQRKAVKASLRKVNKEMQRYTANVITAGQLFQAQRAIQKSTATYLAKKGK